MVDRRIGGGSSTNYTDALYVPSILYHSFPKQRRMYHRNNRKHNDQGYFIDLLYPLLRLLAPLLLRGRAKELRGRAIS